MQVRKILKSRGKYVICIGLIVFVIAQLGLLGVFSEQPKSMPESISASSTKSVNEAAMSNQVQLNNEENTIFFAENYDYIQMYGNPQFWDDEKNMSLDLDGDGTFEDFAIARDSKKGVLLQGRVKQDKNWKSINFWSYNIYELARKASAESRTQVPMIKAETFLNGDPLVLFSLLKEGNYIVKDSGIIDDDFMQISCCDIDEDGIKEVIVSVGNKQNENITAIYEYSEAGEIPFKYCGYISCETVVSYRGDNTLWAFHGKSKGNLYDTYVYENNTLRKSIGE